jgi:hypothetical protein
VHVIPDPDDPHAIVAKVMDAVPSGSYLAISHVGSDLFDEDTRDSFGALMKQMMRQRYTPRSREEVARFFAGTDFVEPGLVSVEEWRQEPDAVREGKSSIYGGVGRKRETGGSLPRNSQDLTDPGHNRLTDVGGRGVAQVD